MRFDSNENTKLAEEVARQVEKVIEAEKSRGQVYNEVKNTPYKLLREFNLVGYPNGGKVSVAHSIHYVYLIIYVLYSAYKGHYGGSRYLRSQEMVYYARQMLEQDLKPFLEKLTEEGLEKIKSNKKRFPFAGKVAYNKVGDDGYIHTVYNEIHLNTPQVKRTFFLTIHKLIPTFVRPRVFYTKIGEQGVFRQKYTLSKEGLRLAKTWFIVVDVKEEGVKI